MSAVSFPSSAPLPRRLPSALGGTSATFAGRSPRRAATRVDADRTDVGDRFVDFLQALHPRKTAENVSADTGCTVAAVAKWIERRSLPMGFGFLQVLNAYGPEFLAAIMHTTPAWLDEARRAARMRALAERHAAIEAEMAALSEGARR